MTALNALLGKDECQQCSQPGLSVQLGTRPGLAAQMILTCAFCGGVAKEWLSPRKEDLAASGDMMSRRKSFKKSLRESFLSSAQGPSQRGRKDKSMTKSPESRRPRRGEEEGSTSSAVASPASRHNESAIDPGSPLSEAKPVERQVEARSTDDALSSMVRCLCFSSSFILHKRLLFDMQRKRKPKLNVKFPVEVLPAVWAQLKSDVIRNCFSRQAFAERMTHPALHYKIHVCQVCGPKFKKLSGAEDFADFVSFDDGIVDSEQLTTTRSQHL
ncbi:hypothetical protein HPB49_001413 [Dermacentor silvarum]|uniref:Uncharacterized protein n=1 Tax=Dermacentor silvarum TaxID=543639 RepID=A0ACB8DSV3_DERSI|nr:hypothetical protein HPB49_001413 [Dermacentor silvarum]